MAKVKVVIESDEGINVKVTKQNEGAALEKLKEDIEQADDDSAGAEGGNDATENA